jgi:hypothetical protein
MVNIDATAGAPSVIVTLPSAVGIAGRTYVIRKLDATANSVRITPNGTETINGVTPVAIGTQYQSRSVMSDGANWMIIAEYNP